MYLSKLKIYGFKSFAQKVEVTFPGNGITSVVGPNGCGKSNIVDSIRWVLGEQRVKQLRSSKMEDVIFSGTADRPAMNFAEVSLVINNDRGVLPSDYSEIQITRRVHRSGDSEYLINNQECRLKDIHALFMDTGMGAASYSLMESKMIDAILSDKAEDRRALFEETAGISKYKQQRKETLRQLEKTSVDLERVEDNLKIRKKSVESFERQAKKAEQFREYQGRLKDLELSKSLNEYNEYSSAFKRLMDMSKEAEANLESLKTQKTLLESQIEERKANSIEEEEAYREAEMLVSNRKLELNNIDNEIRLLRERMSHNENANNKAVEEIEKGRDRIADIKHERVEISEQFTELGRDIEELELEVEKLTERREAFKFQYDESREQVDELSSQRMSQMEGFSQLSIQLQRVKGEITQIQNSELSRNQELTTLTTEIQLLAEERQEFETELTPLAEELDLKKEELDTFTQRRESMREELSTLNQGYQDFNQKYLKASNRYDALSQLEESGEGLEEGVKEIQQKFSSQMKGLLIDHIKVQPQYTHLVESCLGNSAQILVAESEDVSQQWIEAIQQRPKTHLRFLTPNFQNVQLEALSINGAESLLNFIEVDSQYQALVNYLLGDYYLVNEESEASKLAKLSSQPVWFIASSGVMFHSSGLVQVGNQSAGNSGRIERKQEIQRLEAELPTVKSHMESASQNKEELQEKLEELEIHLQDLRDLISDLERAYSQKSQASAIANSRWESLNQQLEVLQEKLSQSSTSIGPLQEQEIQLEDKLESFEESKESLEDRYQEALEQLRELESQKSSLDEEYNIGTQDLSRRKSTVSNLETKLNYLDRQEEELSLRIEAIEQSIDNSDEAMSSSLEELRVLHDKLELENERLIQEEELRDRAKEAYDLKSIETEEIRTQAQGISTDILELTKSMGQSQRLFDAHQAKMDKIRERIFEVYEVDLEEDEFETIEYDEDTVQAEIADLRHKLKALGNINPAALEDFEEEKRLLAEVEQQFEDLDRARISLEKTIRKLDQIARDRFLETFAQIRTNFQDVFSSLMIDGEGRVSLEEGVDPLEAKIEINARPTGKKMRGVSLLSGGERALTATALLFGLYLIKPSPYCILDEVDGPLDDANIGRFVQLLRRFAKQTQFIVVTHNKRTMAASDRLYGVTQEIKGISRIASVHLDEAEGFLD